MSDSNTRPNVLFVITDQHRADHVVFMGKPPARHESQLGGGGSGWARMGSTNSGLTTTNGRVWSRATCDDLAVFKALFARPKDAVDIATMVAAGSVEVDILEQTVAVLLGDVGERADFFARVRSDINMM